MASCKRDGKRDAWCWLGCTIRCQFSARIRLPGFYQKRDTPLKPRTGTGRKGEGLQCNAMKKHLIRDVETGGAVLLPFRWGFRDAWF